MSRKPRGRTPDHARPAVDSLRARATRAAAEGDHVTASRMRTLANKIARKARA